MVTAVTHGILVSVETFYQPEYSSPEKQQHIFAYRITIENRSEFAMKLLRRHWVIFDSVGEYKEVDGEGVVGNQPIIEPLDSFQYVSGCHLNSDIGRMHGHYQMQRMMDGRLFQVEIPEFIMIVPDKLN